MTTEIVLLHHNEAMTTSLAISDGVELQHKNVIELVRKHAESLAEFGGVAFETRPFDTDGGTQWRDVAFLNEQQATLLITFMRNSAVVIKFKIALVKAFFELRDRVAAQQIPQPSGQLFLSHTADIIVAADRTFRAGVRTGRQAGLTTAQSIRRANKLAYLKTGINMLEELQATDYLEDLEKKEATKTDDLDEFFAAFEGGDLPGGGCVPMLSTQLHRIYVYWCARSNIDALKPPKFVQALKELGLFRHVRKRYVDPAGGMFGPVSFLIPTGEIHIPEDMPEREWLGQCVEDVENAIENSGA
jgi:phage regulator Rha-like protein